MLVIKLLATLGQYGALIYIGATYGFKAAIIAFSLIVCNGILMVEQKGKKHG